MGDFSGKTILVTGASSGIGRAAAILLAKAGAHVLVCARREKQGLATVEAAENGARFISLDVTDAASVDRLFAIIAADYGRLDGAFNNAGVDGEMASIPEIQIEEFDRIFATNVRGTWLCLQHEMRIMRAQGYGSIVNTSSVSGMVGFPGFAAYTASKHAIIGMTKAAGLELANIGVRINALCPSGTRSEITDKWTERMQDGEASLAAMVPMKRLADANEPAEVALFLLSDAAKYMTATTIVVDGGYTAS